jgi:hypothetical protein
MKALIVTLLLAPLAVAAVFGQRSSSGIQRQTTVQTDAVTAIRDVSDKAQDLWNIARQQPDTNALELHMNMGAFAGQALALNDIAGTYGEYRNDADLRNGARRLVNLAREIDGAMTRGTLYDTWRQVQQNLLRLSEIYDLGYTATGLSRRQTRGYGQSSNSGGSFRWRGRVDGSDHILLRGSEVSINHLQYNPIKDASYDLTQPLPARNLELRLNKIRGRGKVEILNQPSAWNNYTATILIEDTQGGDDYYEFQLSW